MVRGAGEALAETCQLVLFRPHASYLRKEARGRAAAKKLLSLRLPRNITQGSADPCEIPWVLGMQCLTNEIIFCGFRKHSRSGLQLQTGLQLIQRSSCRAANLQSFAAARHFCSAKILAGGDCGGDGVPAAVGRGTARAKKFPEEICFAPSRVFQVCRTPDYLVLKST